MKIDPRYSYNISANLLLVQKMSRAALLAMLNELRCVRVGQVRKWTSGREKGLNWRSGLFGYQCNCRHWLIKFRNFQGSLFWLSNRMELAILRSIDQSN